MTATTTLIALKTYDDARRQQLQDDNEARLERIARRPKPNQIWVSPFWCEDRYDTVRIFLMSDIPRPRIHDYLRAQVGGVSGTVPLYNRIVLLMNRRLEDAQELRALFDGLPVGERTNDLYEEYQDRLHERFPIQQHQLDRLERAEQRRSLRR